MNNIQLVNFNKIWFLQKSSGKPHPTQSHPETIFFWQFESYFITWKLPLLPEIARKILKDQKMLYVTKIY